MREVFVHHDHARVGFYKSILEQAGIPSFVRNEFANYIVEMPSALFFPALCVIDDADYEEAMRVLGDVYYERNTDSPDWTCAECGAEAPGTFESCWQCGKLRATAPPPDAHP